MLRGYIFGTPIHLGIIMTMIQSMDCEIQLMRISMLTNSRETLKHLCDELVPRMDIRVLESNSCGISSTK